MDVITIPILQIRHRGSERLSYSPKVTQLESGKNWMACCSPWGHKELDTTDRLNWLKTDQIWSPQGSSPITSRQIDGETMETVRYFIFLGSKINEDGDCSHEIKKCLLLGREAMTNSDSILKSRDITLPTKVCLVKAMVSPVVMYESESWTIKKAEHQRIDGFELWCWRRLLRVPWTARRSSQSILKEISPKYSLEGLMLKLKLQYFGHLMQRTESLEKTLMLGKTEDRRRGWQRMRWLDDITDLMDMFEQPLGVGDGQGSLACCSPWVCKESSNWSESTNQHSIQLIEELEYESAFSAMHFMQPQQSSSISGEKLASKLRGDINIKSSAEFKDWV